MTFPRRRLSLAAVLMAAALLLSFPNVATAQTGFTVTITWAGEPDGWDVNAPFGHELSVRATIVAPAALSTVVTTVGGRTLTLTRNYGPSPGTSYWRGTMATSDLANGPMPLVVRATDVNGAFAEAQKTVVHDNPPVLECLSPDTDVLARPDVRVRARCTDDGGPCQITVAGFPSASGAGEINTVISLPAYEGDDGTEWITITGTDSREQEVMCQRRLWVEPSRHLTHVSTFPGRILDVDATRALVYIVDEVAETATWALIDRQTGARQVVLTHAYETWDQPLGWLTPVGALMLADDFGGTLQEWRNGVLSALDELDYPPNVRVAGNWALYVAERVSGSTYDVQLVRRNLSTGTSDLIVTADIVRAELGADGTVIYEQRASLTPSFYRLVRVRNGIFETLLEQAFSSDFQTDGALVAYRHEPAGERALSLLTPLGEERLEESYYSYDRVLVNGGWTAYEGIYPDYDIRLRSPAGERRSGTPGISSVDLDALSPEGDVLFSSWYKNSSTWDRRFLARFNRAPLEVGFEGWPVRRILGQWHMLVGPHLLRVSDTATSILSEGATGTFFDTEVAILNPSTSPVTARVSFFREGGAGIDQERTIPAHARATVRVNDEVGPAAAAVSTVVTTENGPLVVERTMTWDASGYGAHSGSAVEAPRLKWLFAEGAQGYFDTFVLLVNDSNDPAAVRLTFLVEGGSPFVRNIDVQPHARATVYAGLIPELVNKSFSTIVDSTIPIVAERAMYFGGPPQWVGGHESAGVPEAATEWFHAEGATGPVFDTFILLANVNPEEALVHVRFLTDGGTTITRSYTLPPLSRKTIQVDGLAAPLAAASFATTVVSNIPIVSERAMYWSTTGGAWQEAHNSFGVTQTSAKWATADGRVGGARGYQTYVLVANPTSSNAELKLTFMRSDGVQVVRTMTLGPNRRLNIDCNEIPELANSEFGVVVESTNGAPIAVERATYWNAGGVTWAAGTNVTATPIP